MAVSKAAQGLQARIRAALSASSKEQPLLAFASLDGALEAAPNTARELAKRTIASFECKDCSTRMLAEAGSSPFCITCGSDKVTAGAKLDAPKQGRVTASLTDSRLSSIQCRNDKCGSSVIVSSALTTGNAHTHLHCVTCGTSMSEVVDEKSEKGTLDGSGNVPAGDDFTEKDQPELSIEADTKEDASTPLGVSGNPLTPGDLAAKEEPALSIEAATDDQEDGFEDIEDDEDEILLPDDGEDDTDPSEFDSGSDLDLDDTAVDSDEGLSLDDEDPIEASDAPADDDLEIISGEDDADGGDEDADTTPDTVGEEGGDDELSDDEQDLVDNAFSTASTKKVLLSNFSKGTPIADALGLNDTGVNVALVSMAGGKGEGSYVAAIKDSVIVARLAPQNAGVNRSKMHTDGFKSAFRALASKDGMRATLDTLGFKPVRVEVLSKVDVSKQVTAAAEKHAITAAADKRSLADAVALAAVGIDRGQWKGVSNPMRDAVAHALTEFGASEQDANRAARRAVASASKAYVKTLLAQTDKVQAMSAEKREMLAETFDVTTAADDEEVDDDFDSDADDIVASFGSPMRASEPSAARVVSSARFGRLDAVDAQTVMRVLDSDTPLFGG